MDGFWELWQGIKHVMFNGTQGIQAPSIAKEEFRGGEDAALGVIKENTKPHLQQHAGKSVIIQAQLTLPCRQRHSSCI